MTVKVTAYLDEDILSWLQELAACEHRSVAGQIAATLEECRRTSKKAATRRVSRSTRPATRIPDAFQATADMVTWARREVPHVDGRTETANFIDYWKAASGANASKRDWVAAWRVWMRKAAARSHKAEPARRPSIGERAIADAQQLIAEMGLE